jgi:hypothetical protein
MEAAGVTGIIGLVVMVGVFILGLAAIIMPLVVILINSKLNRIVKLLQILAERSAPR